MMPGTPEPFTAPPSNKQNFFTDLRTTGRLNCRPVFFELSICMVHYKSISQDRAMLILVYGFGPYREFRNNITETIIKTLPPLPGLRTAVFPVRFNRRQFIDVLERHKPDHVIGLGQCMRDRIELESRAINRKRASNLGPARPIRKSGTEFLSTTLDINPGSRVGRSDSAGDYVCNYSMYVMLEYISRSGADCRFGFLHIPHNIDSGKGAAVVMRAIAQIQPNSKRVSRK
jgi:pyrrolidone-carboxylate peptidase